MGIAVDDAAAIMVPKGPTLHLHIDTCARPGAGVAGYGSQVTMTMALRRVKAAPATAMSYLSVVWGILAGLAIFHVSCTDVEQGSESSVQNQGVEEG